MSASVGLTQLERIPHSAGVGGPVSLPGLSLGELRGNSYWNARATYLQRVADISYVFGQALYGGLSLSAADMSGRFDGIASAPIYSTALLLIGRTPLGALSLSLDLHQRERMAVDVRTRPTDRGTLDHRLEW